MAITATMVKELRAKTGAGMMDAKKALTENDGDMEASIDWLRTKGLAKAAKKSDRIAAEGLVAVAVKAGKGVAVEVNSETDFVGKNQEFQGMVRKIAEAALEVTTVEALRDAKVDGKPVSEIMTDAISKIGEHMTIRRLVEVEGGQVVSYVHNQVAEGMGKIGVLVGLQGEDKGIGKQIAMHIAATNPVALSEYDVDPATVEREKSVLTEQARESGKPDAVIEKMIVGRMAKFFEEVTLLGQKFVIDPDKTVAQAAKDAGVVITGFARVEVGEGIEKKEEDFAAEVAKTLGGK